MRRTILSALALVLAFALAAEAKAAEQTFDVAGTAWVSTTKLNGKEVPVGIGFRTDGSFFLGFEINGKFEKLEGTYTVIGSQVTIKLNGESKDLTILSKDDDRLVTFGGTEGQKFWIRARNN
jgi:uncharacterized protein (TIGR03066 family)